MCGAVAAAFSRSVLPERSSCPSQARPLCDVQSRLEELRRGRATLADTSARTQALSRLIAQLSPGGPAPARAPAPQPNRPMDSSFSMMDWAQSSGVTLWVSTRSSGAWGVS